MENREVGVDVWRKQIKGGEWGWWVEMTPFFSALILLSTYPSLSLSFSGMSEKQYI